MRQKHRQFAQNLAAAVRKAATAQSEGNAAVFVNIIEHVAQTLREDSQTVRSGGEYTETPGEPVIVTP